MSTLVASLVLTVLTLAAELGGLGFVLNYFFDVSVGFFVLVAVVAIAAAIYFLPFDGLERDLRLPRPGAAGLPRRRRSSSTPTGATSAAASCRSRRA